MRRIMLIGLSWCGKTSLTQCMRREALRYQKAQTIVWSPATIDTPGEYLENRCLYNALLVGACGVDIIALVLNTDASWSPFFPDFTGPMNQPVIGPVTKTGLANPQRISSVEDWLVQAGAQKVFVTSALENTGVDGMFIFLNTRGPSCLTK